MQTTFADELVREAEEHERQRIATEEKRRKLREQAETITKTLPPAGIIAGRQRGEDLATLFFPEPSANVARLERALATLEAERDAKVKGRPGDVYRLARFAEQIGLLREELEDARALRDACRAVAQRRVKEALTPLIEEQVRLRDELLQKAVPFNDRIRELEKMRGASMSTKVLSWLRR